MEPKEAKNEKRNFKWILISFGVCFVVFGGFMAWCVYADELHRPGSSENVSLEMLYAASMIGFPAGIIGVALTSLYRWFNKLAK